MKTLVAIWIVLAVTLVGGTVWMDKEINKRVEACGLTPATACEEVEAALTPKSDLTVELNNGVVRTKYAEDDTTPAQALQPSLNTQTTTHDRLTLTNTEHPQPNRNPQAE